jgi:dienelactone hydrolase
MHMSATTVSPPVVPVMPELSGRHSVGTVDLHLVDSSRSDPWYPDRARELMVTVSHPTTVDSGTWAPWSSPGAAAVGGAILSSPDFFDLPPDSVAWREIRRRALVNAPVRPGSWPVVVFSPGFGSTREMHANVVDDLASHGYAVVSVSHTHEAAVVEFSGGRIEPAAGPDRSTAAMRTATGTRVADLRFVLDALPGKLPGLDLSRIGAVGHSFGGYTVGESMVHDQRIAAGVNLDGPLEHTGSGTTYSPGLVVRQGLDRPFLLLGGTMSHTDMTVTRSWADFWPNQRGWKRDLHLEDGAHHSFSDFQWLLPQLPAPPQRRTLIIGAIDPDRSLLVQHTYLAAFFDLHLKGAPTTLFDEPGFPEARLVE